MIEMIDLERSSTRFGRLGSLCEALEIVPPTQPLSSGCASCSCSARGTIAANWLRTTTNRWSVNMRSSSNERMELVFLEHCYRWVTSEGVLVFVVPAPAVGTCARLLTSQFDRICVFRLEHPESVRFNQVVVFGIRKKSHLRGEPKGADDLLRVAYKPHLLPVLNQEVVERYAIPPSSPATIAYTGLPLDAIEDALQRSVAMQNARGILVRKQQKMTGRPVTPLHKGHVGLLACSGMLNGFFGEGETRHIAHW